MITRPEVGIFFIIFLPELSSQSVSKPSTETPCVRVTQFGNSDLFAEGMVGTVEMFCVPLLECKYVCSFQTATGGYKSESRCLHFDVESWWRSVGIFSTDTSLRYSTGNSTGLF